MTKNSMGKKELLGAIEFAYGCKRLKEQAHAQLVEIVEEYYGDPNKKSLGKLAEEYGVPHSLVHAIDTRLSQDYEQSGEPVKDTAGNPVSEMSGVDAKIFEWLEMGQALGMLLVPKNGEHFSDGELAGKADLEWGRLVIRRIKQLLQQSQKQVDEEFIRRKADELMCDVDSGDEIANYEFLHDLAKQLLSHSSTSGNDMSDKRVVTREDISSIYEASNRYGFDEVVEMVQEELGIEVVEK